MYALIIINGFTCYKNVKANKEPNKGIKAIEEPNKSVKVNKEPS